MITAVTAAVAAKAVTDILYVSRCLFFVRRLPIESASPGSESVPIESASPGSESVPVAVQSPLKSAGRSQVKTPERKTQQERRPSQKTRFGFISPVSSGIVTMTLSAL